MKIKNVAIKNFRGYSDEINSDFEDLTAFVGKNDIGKSTILEALDIFFNDGKGVTKLDKADLNVESKARQETDISIRVCFTDLLVRTRRCMLNIWETQRICKSG